VPAPAWQSLLVFLREGRSGRMVFTIASGAIVATETLEQVPTSTPKTPSPAGAVPGRRGERRAR
jgi:hypothetical protein